MTRRRWIYPSDGTPCYEVGVDHAQAPTGPLIYGDLPSYQSPIDGRWIDGRVARREDMARSGSRPWEGMASEQREAHRQQGYERDRQDRRLDQSIDRAWSQLSERNRRALSDG